MYSRCQINGQSFSRGLRSFPAPLKYNVTFTSSLQFQQTPIDMLIIANLFILSVFTLPQCTFKNLRDVCGCLCDGKCWSLNVRRNSPMMWFDTPHVVGEVGRSCFNGDSGGGTPASNQCFAKVGPHETTRIWDTDGSKICGHIGTGVHEGDPFVKFCDSVLTRHPRQYQATVGV